MSLSYSFLSSNTNNPYLLAMFQILCVVSKEKEYFIKNTKHLAWVMFEYNQIYDAGRADKNKKTQLDWGYNAKDPILALIKTMGGQNEYSNLVYDAWAFGLEHEGLPRQYLEKELKINKSIDDYYELLADVRLPPYQKAATKHLADDSLLCEANSYYDWNSAGYLSQTGPYEVDLTLFYNFQYCKDVVDITNQIPHLTNEFIQKSIKKMNRDKTNENNIRLDPVKLQEKINKDMTAHFIGFITQKDPTQDKNNLNTLSFDELKALYRETRKSHQSDEERIQDEKQNQEFQNTIKNINSTKTKTKTKKEKQIQAALYSKISEKYSNISTMPENAHESYILAGLRIAARILSNRHESESNQNLAKKFVEKWSGRVPNYFQELNANLPELWSDMPWVLGN